MGFNPRCDNLFAAYFSQTVTSSQTLVGADIELIGAMGLSVQTICTNGAAGTLYVDGSNQLGTTATWQNITSQTLTANQTAILNYSLIDSIMSMYKARLRFVSTATGNLVVSANARRVIW